MLACLAVLRPCVMCVRVRVCVSYRGPSALSEVSSIRYWLGHLAQEVEERCSEDRRANKRMPTSITVAFTTQVRFRVFVCVCVCVCLYRQLFQSLK